MTKTTWMVLKGMLCCAPLLLGGGALAQTNDVAAGRHLSLRDCIEMALLNNRALQIERINPEVARLTLSASYGYYDPVLTSRVARETATDTGGVDPADFSQDAIYSAESEVANAGVIGFLPSGMSYSLGGSYAHSDGTRNTLDFDSYKLGASVFVQQPLLKNFWTDAGRTLIKVSKKNLKITELGVDYLVMDIINQVQQGYYEFLFTREDVKVQERLLASKEKTLTGVRRQVELGTYTVLEERLAISQAARIQADLIAASNAVVQAENQLKALLGYTFTNWTGAPIIPAERLLMIAEPLDLAERWREGFLRRPDLAQMIQDVERTDLNLKYRRNQLFPSLDLVAGYGRRGADAVQLPVGFATEASLSSALEQLDNAAAPNDVVGVVFSIPLSRVTERANYKAGKQLKAQAQLRLKQKEEMILREISDAFHNAESARERVAATQRARDYAQAALEAEEQKLAGGKSSLFFVLQLQGDLAAAESAEIRARADYNKALSQLHFADGTLLEQNRMVVEIK